jgi:hypothetical protein
MNLSDKIGEQLKQRGERARQEKKSGDMNRKILSYVSELPENKGIVPGFDLTKDEIANLPNVEANAYVQALVTGQDIAKTGATTESVKAGTRLTEANINRANVMTPLTAELTRAQTNRAHQIMSEATLDTVGEQQTTQAVRMLLTEKPPIASDDLQDDLGSPDMGPFGRRMLNDQERLGLHLNDIAQSLPAADMGTVVKLHNEMQLSKPDSFEPRAVQVPLTDGSGRSATVIMTGPKQGQLFDEPPTRTKGSGGYEKIPGLTGAYGIPDPDNPGEWKNVRHQPPSELLSNFDVDGSNTLDEGEINQFKAEWMRKTPMATDFMWRQMGIKKGHKVPDKATESHRAWGKEADAEQPEDEETEDGKVKPAAGGISLQGFEAYKADPEKFLRELNKK